MGTKESRQRRLRLAFKGLTDPDAGGIQVVCSGIPDLDRVEGAEMDRFLGQRYLGAGLGAVASREACVRKKVFGWAEYVEIGGSRQDPSSTCLLSLGAMPSPQVEIHHAYDGCEPFPLRSS